VSIRILLVDDNEDVRKELRRLLEDEPGLDIVAEAGDGRVAVRLARELLPEVILMDIAMPHLNGIEATRQIMADGQGIKIIGLSMYSSQAYVEGMLSAGACGYVLKDQAHGILTEAIRSVMAGQIYVSVRLTDRTNLK